jgi:hypothetical protein
MARQLLLTRRVYIVPGSDELADAVDHADKRLSALALQVQEVADRVCSAAARASVWARSFGNNPHGRLDPDGVLKTDGIRLEALAAAVHIAADDLDVLVRLAKMAGVARDAA